MTRIVGPVGWVRAAAGLCLLAAPAIAIADQPCFTAADNARLSFEVIQQAPPPRGKAARYDYFPLTGAASMQLGVLAKADPRYATYYFQWANRSNAVLTNRAGRVLPRKLNIQPAVTRARHQRTGFTSVARADACTLAQTAAVLGQTQRAQAFAADGQISLLGVISQPDGPAAGPDDRCLGVPGGLLPAYSGVLLDYEVQDGRSAAETLHFLREFTQLVHAAGRQAILLLDPFDAKSQVYNGISQANAHAIVALFDQTTIFLWSKNATGNLPASYAAQKQMIAAGGPFEGKRLLIDFELAGTTLADAAFVRRTILSDHLAGVLFWRNHAVQGGDCASDVNRKIAAIALPSRTIAQ